MRNSVLLSISCITYNHAPYIRQCLEGFVMQKTDFLFEVLIHDDASTDGTADIIREYEAKYPEIIKPIYQIENQWRKGRRGSAVFNFPRVKGKYVAMCEGDDYWTDPYKLQRQVDFLEANEDYSMCFHKVKIINDEVNLITSWYDHLQTKEYTAEEIMTTWTVPTCSVVFRSSIINNIPNHKDFSMGDNVLFLTCAMYGKLYCENIVMGEYRRNSGGLTASFAWKKKIVKHYEALKECFPNVSPDILDNSIMIYQIEFMMTYIKKLDIISFFRQLIVSLSTYKMKFIQVFLQKTKNYVKKHIEI
ncbi:glycosyltransferase [Bacteroidales bacterium OttesenSCG-928-I21]|nr:glycosyltransferase [Bacteroidales bacterium OttesenSCG-928-I21]